MKARIKFRKYGVMKFIGHLDVMRFFQKAMRRAEIPIAFTGGYSPHMVMSFAQPLGVGITSDGEYFDIELTEPISSKEAVKRLNSVMVEGIEVISFLQISDEKKASGMSIVALADYLVTFKNQQETRNLEQMAETFMKEPAILILKKTKRSEQEVDIKPMIHGFQLKEDGFFLRLCTGSEMNLKPDLVMEAFFTFIGEKHLCAALHYHRLEVYAKSEQDQDTYCTLESLGTLIK